MTQSSFVSAVLRVIPAALLVGCSSLASLPMQEKTLAPGVRYQRYRTDQPNDVHVLVIEGKHGAARLEVFRTRGLVPTSRLVSEAEREGIRVLGAVNGDFFEASGWPTGNQVTDGKVVAATHSVRSHLAVDSAGNFRLTPVAFMGSITTLTGGRWAIDEVNHPVKTNNLGAFTDAWYDSASVLAQHRGVWLHLPGGRWSVTDTLRMVVDSIAYAVGEIGPKQLLIVPGDSTSELAKAFSAGDTVSVFLGFFPTIPSLRELIGGAGRILTDGRATGLTEAAEEEVSANFIERRHPRTFLACDKDTTRLFVCVVDGRRQESVGMSFAEMAAFLKTLGAWNALNFDGGGSSTMIVGGSVVNNPSDRTGERPVGNSLLIRDPPLSR